MPGPAEALRAQLPGSAPEQREQARQVASCILHTCLPARVARKAVLRLDRPHVAELRPADGDAAPAARCGYYLKRELLVAIKGLLRAAAGYRIPRKELDRHGRGRLLRIAERASPG